MKRWHLVELEDLPWWPRAFRDAETDYIATAIHVAKTYSAVVPRLARALEKCAATQIIDLCSGGGGPWADLLPSLRMAGVDPVVWLTDKYPNTTALARVAEKVPGIRFEADSVSATDVPGRLTGFRTLFTAFHHFRPTEARAILASAVRDRQGIAIFEGTSRTPAFLAMMLFAPFSVWALTPLIRPFRWSRLFWTYVIPVVPIAVMIDGFVSCLRAYTHEEMKAMAIEVGGKAFDWEAGSDYLPGSAVPISYLIGIPRLAADEPTYYPELEIGNGDCTASG